MSPKMSMEDAGSSNDQVQEESAAPSITKLDAGEEWGEDEMFSTPEGKTKKRLVAAKNRVSGPGVSASSTAPGYEEAQAARAEMAKEGGRISNGSALAEEAVDWAEFQGKSAGIPGTTGTKEAADDGDEEELVRERIAKGM